ncbi:hypothetical protein ILUMI_13625 [Ignelater luminosus]|uniref:Uncharacterized protein n=1 Tax=Ignelater luminosus TaxID=2038154 RepID=A0A8K0CWC9_IGNLU|nr:hypothetical protein ILUMI_13625 [Ignelater luminosus]
MYLISTIPDCNKPIVETKISLFCSKLFYRWKGSGRNVKSFLKQNKDWLRKLLIEEDKTEEAGYLIPTTFRGRPAKLFRVLSTRAKQSQYKELTTHGPEELAFATHMSYSKTIKEMCLRLLKKAATLSPHSLKTMKAQQFTCEHPYSAEEALALMIDLKLTKDQYLNLKKS